MLSKELFFAAGMAGISCGVLLLFFLYKEKKRKAEDQQLFEQLKEELQNIKKGNYELLHRHWQMFWTMPLNIRKKDRSSGSGERPF